MAGAGYKLFNTGDVLTAAQVNTYLQEQVVMVFANATARTTALSGVLAEGMVTYLKDTDALEIYSGAAWVSYGSGDITGITTGATSGLTGGVTSGTADLKLNTTAKGGLLVGTGSGTVTELTVGSNNTVLTADSSTASGLKWAAASGGGKVLQVVSASTTGTTTISSTTYTDTGITATITPTATNSKILVLIMYNAYASRSTGEVATGAKILRASTSIAEWQDYAFLYTKATGASATAIISTGTLTYLDSPATTSATTYKLQAKLDNTANSASLVINPVTNVCVSTITLLEIGA